MLTSDLHTQNRLTPTPTQNLYTQKEKEIPPVLREESNKIKCLTALL